MMNNKILLGIVVVVLLVVAAIFFSKKGYKPNPAPTQGPQITAGADTITIQNFAFSPSTLTVKAGTKVTWVNQDSAVHTVNSDIFDSPNLAKGETFEFTFSDKGSFDYTCGIHPTMQGKIIVE